MKDIKFIVKKRVSNFFIVFGIVNISFYFILKSSRWAGREGRMSGFLRSMRRREFGERVRL